MKPIASQYVLPFVKRQKSDAADAEAIFIAAGQPETHFVALKNESQQARTCRFPLQGASDSPAHGTGECPARQALRVWHGRFKRQCYHNRIEEIICDEGIELPTIVRKACQDLLEQIDELSARIAERTRVMVGLPEESNVLRRLETMPGIGPLTALALEAFAPPMESFCSGRDFAELLGLVPRQFSSCGKERLGRVSKAGQADIRRLLIIVAMTRLNWPSRSPQRPAVGSRECSPASSARW